MHVGVTNVPEATNLCDDAKNLAVVAEDDVLDIADLFAVDIDDLGHVEHVLDTPALGIKRVIPPFGKDLYVIVLCQCRRYGTQGKCACGADCAQKPYHASLLRSCRFVRVNRMAALLFQRPPDFQAARSKRIRQADPGTAGTIDRVFQRNSFPCRTYLRRYRLGATSLPSSAEHLVHAGRRRRQAEAAQVHKPPSAFPP